MNGPRIDWTQFEGRQLAISKSAGHKRLALTEIASAIRPYGFVYVFGARNLVKIGMTMHSVYRRWHGIKSANPWLEKPLYVTGALCGRVIEVERMCHEALKAYRVEGEWFECERLLAIDTVRRIANGP